MHLYIPPKLVKYVAQIANEILEEEGSQQRFTHQGKPMRRTSVVDPEYHAKLTAQSRKDSDDRARRMIGGRLPIV